MTWLAYTIITLGSSALWGVISGWLIYFYLPPGGQPLVPLVYYSVVMLISRAVNILAGLPIGYVSDRTHSIWGRRLPYVIGGAFFVPMLFVLLWRPPVEGESIWNLLYLAFTLMAFNIAYEVHQTPYDSLLPELAVGEKERVRIATWKSSFLLGGNILAGFAGPMIEKWGYNQSMLIFATAAAPMMILPGFFLLTRLDLNVQPVRHISFFTSLKTTLTNRPFQIFTASWGLMWIASSFVLSIMPFIVTQICRLREADTIYFYLTGIVATLASFPFVNRLSARYGVKKIYRGSLLAGAIVMPTLLLIGDSVPLPLFVQGLLWIALQSIGLAGAQILPSAMAAEITDNDERTSGHRREGSFYSVWALLNQVASGTAAAAIPLFLLLGRSQSDPQGPLGVRLLGLAGGLFLLVSFWIFRQFSTEPMSLRGR